MVNTITKKMKIMNDKSRKARISVRIYIASCTKPVDANVAIKN